MLFKLAAEGYFSAIAASFNPSFKRTSHALENSEAQRFVVRDAT